MRARDLAEPFPVVPLEEDALEATRMLAERGLPGLVVVDDHGVPIVILPASQVLRFALPEYVEEDPNLAGVFGEKEADTFCRPLRGKTVAQLMPSKEFLPRRERDRPIVGAEATMVEVASVMSRQHSPVVAVMDGDHIVGVITVHRLLGAALAQA